MTVRFWKSFSMKNKFTLSPGQVNIRQWSWSWNSNFHVLLPQYFFFNSFVAETLSLLTCMHYFAKSTILCKCTQTHCQHCLNHATKKNKPEADNLIVLFPLPIFSRMIPPFFSLLSAFQSSPQNKNPEASSEFSWKSLKEKNSTSVKVLAIDIHYTRTYMTMIPPKKWFYFCCWAIWRLSMWLRVQVHEKQEDQQTKPTFFPLFLFSYCCFLSVQFTTRFSYINLQILIQLIA